MPKTQDPSSTQGNHLDCNCVLPEHTCSVCEQAAGIEEIPY